MGIGKTLLDVLQEKGENPNGLAEKVGVSPSTIYSITKRDNMKVDISLLARICKVLDVPMDRFYNEYISENKDNKKIAPIEINENDSEKQKLIANYDKMNQTAQRTLVEYSEFMASKPENLKGDTKTVKMNA